MSLDVEGNAIAVVGLRNAVVHNMFLFGNAFGKYSINGITETSVGKYIENYQHFCQLSTKTEMDSTKDLWQNLYAFKRDR